jgi:hypothetical protein
VRVEIRVSACFSRTLLCSSSSFNNRDSALKRLDSHPNCFKDDSFVERDSVEENRGHAQRLELPPLRTIVGRNDGRDFLIGYSARRNADPVLAFGALRQVLSRAS